MRDALRIGPSLPSPLRVLLVEDNEGDALLVRTVFDNWHGWSFDVQAVTRLNDALVALEGSMPVDVVLLDLALPDSQGLESLTRIRERAPRVPVVVMTGIGDEETDWRAVQEGAAGYLVKGEMTPPLLIRTIRHAIERYRMIEELKAAREAARHLATHDFLTGIPNRLLLEDRLQNALANARRSGAHLAVVMIDLNRFKSINDTFGHTTGDAVLQCVAQRFSKIVRQSDTIARMGGDEFALVLTNMVRDTDAARVAQKVLDVLARPIAVSSEQFQLSASLGIATFPRDGPDAVTLLKNADLAMYQAKREGAGDYQFHSPEMNECAVERLQIEQRLSAALLAGEFLLHYQAQVELATLRIVGAEALIRWQDPAVGLRPPASFLAVAEETGQIREIGEWVLRTACRDARSFAALAGVGGDEFRISVNISPRQLRQAGFDSVVDEVLAEERLRPEQLTLEIVESSLVDDSGTTMRVLQGLERRGVRISIDDFGQGHAALAYLKRIPFHEIKVDRAFVAGIPDSPTDATITSAILTLAQGLGATAVAEGVETAEQIAFLREAGCPLAQGFLFARPIPAADFAALLARGLPPIEKLQL